jgi:hypothetical protein
MNDYERERAERIAANKARLAELVPDRLPVAPVPAAGAAKKRAAPAERPPLRDKSTRTRNPVQYFEETDPGDGAGRGGRGERGIYGTADGTSCHSCRQKTTSYKAICTNCPLRWCAPCLRIRYGENAQSANDTGEWICGKCRGRCLCSNCRRKEGMEPTGILGPRAEAAGFDSVEAYLAAGR